MQDQRDARSTCRYRSIRAPRNACRQHRIDVERAADVVGRVDGADLDVRLVVGGEHRAQVLGGDRKDLGARDRIAGHAAAEVAHACPANRGCLRRGSRRGRRARRCRRRAGCGRWRSASCCRPTILTWLPTWPDMATDGSLCVLKRVERGRVQADLRAGAGDLDDLADRAEAPARAALTGARRHSSREAADFIEKLVQVRFGRPSLRSLPVLDLSTG